MLSFLSVERDLKNQQPPFSQPWTYLFFCYLFFKSLNSIHLIYGMCRDLKRELTIFFQILKGNQRTVFTLSANAFILQSFYFFYFFNDHKIKYRFGCLSCRRHSKFLLVFFVFLTQAHTILHYTGEQTKKNNDK